MPCAVTGSGVEESPDGALYDFEQLSAVADAVLYEGYLLYPYRRSSAKNRVRWQFGVLFPRDWVESEGPVVPGCPAPPTPGTSGPSACCGSDGPTRACG
ncbi:hypothetical protein ACFQV4_30510 [Streptomyces thermocarboxydus]